MDNLLTFEWQHSVGDFGAVIRRGMDGVRADITASMAAQVATPMVSGLLMDKFGMHVLFPYAAVFTALAFVTMLFVKHGDSKPAAKVGLEVLDVDND